MSPSSEKMPDLPAVTIAPDAHIVDANGRRVRILSQEDSRGEILLRVQAESGPEILVPPGILAIQDDGTYRLPFSFDKDADKTGTSRIIFPIMQEELHLSKRTVDTGKGIRLHKTVSENQHVVDQFLQHDELVVEHVPVNRILTEAELPQMRYEGDTVVVPVLEEVLVVQKQWRLKEDLRITRCRREVRLAQHVSVRSEHVEIERFDEGKKGMA